MNISGLGSLSWYTGTRSTTSTQSASSSTTTGTDTASISSDAFAALLQNLQHGGSSPPAMTDAKAATIGSSLKEQNPDWFKALDGDGDGTLSAKELKTGMDALRGSSDTTGTGGPPPRPDAMTDDQAASIGTAMKKDNASLFAALDSDSSGSLTAKELKTGLDALHQAMAANGMGPPPPPPGGTGGESTSQDQMTDGTGSDLLSQLQSSTTNSSWSDYQSNMMSDILQSLFATSKA